MTMVTLASFENVVLDGKGALAAMRTDPTIQRAPQIAVEAQNLEAGRVALATEPKREVAGQSLSMRGAIVVDMVDSEEQPLHLATTDAQPAVGSEGRRPERRTPPRGVGGRLLGRARRLCRHVLAVSPTRPETIAAHMFCLPCGLAFQAVGLARSEIGNGQERLVACAPTLIWSARWPSIKLADALSTPTALLPFRLAKAAVIARDSIGRVDGELVERSEVSAHRAPSCAGRTRRSCRRHDTLYHHQAETVWLFQI